MDVLPPKLAAARLGIKIIVSLWNLTAPTTRQHCLRLSTLLSNVRNIRQFFALLVGEWSPRLDQFNYKLMIYVKLAHGTSNHPSHNLLQMCFILNRASWKKNHCVVVGKVTKSSLIGKLDKGTLNMNRQFGSLSSGMLETVTTVTVTTTLPW